jgi:hypothetical protein
MGAVTSRKGGDGSHPPSLRFRARGQTSSLGNVMVYYSGPPLDDGPHLDWFTDYEV